MQPFVRVHCGNDLERPEIQVSGSPQELATFGEFLLELKTSTVIDVSAAPPDRVYPLRLESIKIDVESSGNDLVKVRADSTCLRFAGTTTALDKIGQSLVNVFGPPNIPAIGYHFHLDYFEENGILDETTCTLIFIRDY